MADKNVQVGFRCTRDTHEKLRQLAFEMRVPMQHLVEEGVEMRLGLESGEQPQDPWRTSTPKEREFLKEMLEFVRNAPAEEIRLVRSMAASIIKLARRPRAPRGRKAR